MSPSPRRAWIEIVRVIVGADFIFTSPSPRRAWIEIRRFPRRCAKRESPSPRRAWIEIFLSFGGYGAKSASPSPRRAWIEISNSSQWQYGQMVALPTEGVD